MTATTETIDRLIEEAYDEMWAVVVLDDDRTTFATVIRALMEIFEHSESAATALAWMVHREGRARVAVGARSFADAGVLGLHERGIGALREPL